MPTNDLVGALADPAEELQRIASPNAAVLTQLGLLSDLPGTWVGTGFNLIARPNKQHGTTFLLQLNATIETLEFTAIGGEVPNRGSEQNDIFIFGARYLQRVSDALTHGALHIEPGFWLNVPSTSAPTQGPTLVRQSAIPHGDSLVAESTFTAQVAGPPVLQPVDTLPFLISAAIPGLNQVPNPSQLGSPYTDPYQKSPLPAGLPPGLNPVETIQNPVLILAAAIQKQTITNTIAIGISTGGTVGGVPTGGIVNIPFVSKNANAAQLDATFWIETVKGPSGPFMQLQYVQRVVLDFEGIHWPHVSVATLVKQ